MTVLQDYKQFAGLHWETGTVRNFLDYSGVTAPHTGKPYTEALLMGVSGGAVMGYFLFAYEGYDPMARILTRNTFDPLDRLLERLGVVQNRMHTSSAKKGRSNLVDTLNSGIPAIVWTDLWSLPYNNLSIDEGMWAMFPVVVYGYDESEDRAWIADRARVPLTVATSELDAARARVKKDKFRILTLEPPNPDKLASAVNAGIWDCIKLYTEKPPKGSKNNFGLAAFRWWAEMLTKPKARRSWEKEFPAGAKMYAGLTSAFTDINTFGKDGCAEREMYADFLDEAATILSKPALIEVARQFRQSAYAWEALGRALLPDDVEPLRETRELMLKIHHTFLDKGSDALADMQQLTARLNEIKQQVAEDFPLDEGGVVALREQVAEQLLGICAIEEQAVNTLREAMA